MPERFAAEQTGGSLRFTVQGMRADSRCPTDLRLVFHDSLSESYELSKVLLATANFDGTLQLLTSGWERVLGYRRTELQGKTLADLLWCNRSGAASIVAAILDLLSVGPVELRVRCRSGLGKRFELHRHYDQHEQIMYIVAEETCNPSATALGERAERRAAVRL